MFDSPRPADTMPAASIALSPFDAVRAARPALRRLALAAVALSAAAMPMHAMHASRSAPARPATHSAAHLAGHSGTSAPSSARSRQATAHSNATVLAAAQQGRHGRHGSAEEAPVSNRRGKTAVAVRPLTARERREAEVHEQALAALQQRAGRHSSQHSAQHGTQQTLTGRESARFATPRQAAQERTLVLSADTHTAAADAPADAHVQDRVHAWYRTRHADTDSTTDATGQADPGPVDKPAPVHASARPPAKPSATIVATATPPAQTAPSPTPRKATAEDFAGAAAAQRETIAAARDQQAHQTTAEDDNADAESRIPSTAPTEREPTPFVHGSFGEGAATPSDLSTNRSQSGAAPVVRETPPAATAAAHIAPPQHVDLKHRGDGLNSAIAQDQATQAARTQIQTHIQAQTQDEAGNAAAPRGASSTIPVATAADSSPRAIRALAQQTAASPTPVLKLPAPPSGALRKDQPAVAAVESGARRRELDPAVISGMAEQTFDEGAAPATARTAVALAAPNAVAGLVPARTHAPVAADDADANLPPASLVSVNVFDRQGRLILVPPMKGSHEILVHQNQMAVSDGLARIQDDRDLLELRQRKLLVALPDEDSTYPDDRLPANRRYARPWTVRFLRDLARAHYARFGTPLIVTSAARTVEFQRRLVRVNGNAAPPTGDVASPHLYGQAMDIGKGHMSLTELTWMRAYLTPVENDGKIDVEEEFQQSCFHISVYRRYLGLPAPGRTPGSTPNAPAQMLTARQAPAPDDGKTAEKKRRRISTALLATGLR